MLTHGSFPHTTEALECSISIQKLWRLLFIQFGTGCTGGLNARQSLSSTQRWRTHQTSGLQASAYGANGGKNTESTNHPKGSRHIFTGEALWEGGSIILSLRMNNSSHCCYIFMLSFPFNVTPLLTRELKALFLLSLTAKQRQSNAIF